MGERYTHEYVESRLKDRGFILKDNYTRAYDKHTVCCVNCDHHLEIVPAKIFSGRGCPSCSGRIRYSIEYVNSRLSGTSITLEKILPRVADKNRRGMFRCSKGHVFESYIKNILKREGCPACSKRVTLTAEDINARLFPQGFFTEDAPSISTECIDITCLKCSHVFTRKLSNQLNKMYGCPNCSENYGKSFDYELPAMLYYLRIDTGSETLYKIGITNRSVKARFSKQDLDKITVLRTIEFDTGQKAFDLEQYYLHLFKDCRYKGEDVLKSGGNTEILTTDILGLDTLNQKPL